MSSYCDDTMPAALAGDGESLPRGQKCSDAPGLAERTKPLSRLDNPFGHSLRGKIAAGTEDYNSASSLRSAWLTVTCE